MWLAILIRLILPLAILKSPIAGAFIAILLDYFDLEIINSLDPGNLSHYQQIDKILDLYYLSLELYVFTRIRNNLVKYSAISLFFYRLVGIITFELTSQKSLLVYFPNTFEYIYLAYLIQFKVFNRTLFRNNYFYIIFLSILIVLKIFHEYLLHMNTIHPWNENKYVKMIINPDFNRFVP